MFPYLICFTSSLFLFWLGQKIKYGQCEPIRWFIYVIVLLIPTTLAAVRDRSIGTDTSGYAYSIFKEACEIPNMGGFSAEYSSGWIGTGYLWLNFAISKITDNFNVALFFIMLIEVIFVFLAIYKWKDKFPIWIGMFVFYAFFFNLSLNAIRQCLALSIAFYGIKYIFERRFLFFVFWIWLGSLFHVSVFIILLYYPLFWFTNKYRSNKFTFLFFASFLLLIIFSNQILIPFLSSISGMVPFAEFAIKYLAFVEKDGSGYKNFAYFLFLVILFLCNKNKILKQIPDIGHFLEIVAIITSVAHLTTFFAGKYAERFTIISNWWLCFLIPIIFYSYNRMFPKTVINATIIIYSFFYWYSVFIYFGHHETQDYSSSILSNIF